MYVIWCWVKLHWHVITLSVTYLVIFALEVTY